MNVRYSTKDNIPDVFFRETLAGVPLCVNGIEYDSVNTCFNARKFSKRMWDPRVVPYKHNSKLDAYGFLVDEDLAILRDDKRFSQQQFEMLIKARIFIMYYKQLTAKCSTSELARYTMQYKACENLLSVYPLDAVKVTFNNYKVDDSEEECIVVCNEPKKFDIDFLKKFKTIHMSYTDLISSYDVRTFNGMKDLSIYVHNVDINSSDIVVFEIIMNKCEELHVSEEPLDLDKLPIVAMTTIDTSADVNWDNVIYQER